LRRLKGGGSQDWLPHKAASGKMSAPQFVRKMRRK